MAPITIEGLYTQEGGFSPRAIDYYVERAKGGAGLIITGGIKVENEIEEFYISAFPCMTWNPSHFIQTASELTEGVHAYGAKIFVQLSGGFGRSAIPGRDS